MNDVIKTSQRNWLRNETIQVSPLDVAFMIRNYSGQTIAKHKAELGAQVIEELTGRVCFLNLCIERKEQPTEEALKDFMDGWRLEASR